MRVECLCRKGAVERIRHLIVAEGRGLRCELTVKRTLKDFARSLGVTHESLYRDLASMERERVIEVHASGMQDAGGAMHHPASKLALVAKDASVTGNLNAVLASLHHLNQAYVVCQAAFRLQ